MAIIGDIRKRSGLLIIIVGVALAAFVLGDFLSTRPSHRSINIGEVEGEEIPILAYNQRLEENLNMRRQNSQTGTLSAQEQYNVRQSTWDEMIREIIMDKNYEAIGLNISTEELDDLVRGPNPHSYIRQSFTDPNTGTFDPTSVTNFLKNLNQVDPQMRDRYLYIEKAIKDDQLSKKYNDLVLKAYYIPEELALKDFGTKNRQASLSVVSLPYKSIPDEDVTVSDQEMKRFYDNNKFRFTQEQSRSIDYIIFEIQPSDEDREKISEEFDRLYAEFKEVQDIPLFVNTKSDTRYDSTWFKREDLSPRIEEELFDTPVGTILSPYVEDGKHIMAKLIDTSNRPDSLKASHILVTYQGTGVSQTTRTKDQAKNRADSIFNEIKRNRSKFSELATSLSDDGSAAENKGDLGWFLDGQMVYPFNQAVLDGKVGEIVQVESQFGFHIVEITGKTQPIKKARIAIIDRVIEPSTRTIQEIYAKASQFASTNKTLTAFDNAVVDAGISKRSADNLQPMDNSIPGITVPREIIRWAYNNKTKVGDVSPAFDVDGAFVVAALKSIKEKGTMPFDLAKGSIEPLVLRDKKAEILVKRMEDAIKENGDIKAVATKLGEDVQNLEHILLSATSLSTLGREPDVIGKIFAMEENQTSKPIEGEQAVYLIRVDKYTVTEPQDDDLNGIRRVHTNNYRSRVTRELTKTIEDNAKVIDNRLMFY